MTRSRRRAQRGFTLIESMIALAILAIGLAGFSTAMVASGRQDRRNAARAAAQTLADELARSITRWKFTDPRLAVPSVPYTGTDFSKPVVSTFTITPAAPMPNPTTAASVTETLDNPPNYTEADLLSGPGWGGRTLDQLNLTEPGRTFVFNRYWNVALDTNTALKLVAVHVTYSLSGTERGVATAYASVNDESILADLITQ